MHKHRHTLTTVWSGSKRVPAGRVHLLHERYVAVVERPARLLAIVREADRDQTRNAHPDDLSLKSNMIARIFFQI